MVATGGGTVCFAANARAAARARASPSGSTRASPPWSRASARGGKEDRPLFRDETQALALYRERLPAYRAAADLAVDVGPAEAAEEVAARIVLRLAERRCAT